MVQISLTSFGCQSDHLSHQQVIFEEVQPFVWQALNPLRRSTKPLQDRYLSMLRLLGAIATCSSFGKL
ncbi:MAG: hypothetical protein AAF821_07715 [Cyanobacteria bacterium P01_D01_bin.156]